MKFLLFTIVLSLGIAISACKSGASSDILEVDKMKVLLLHQLMFDEFQNSQTYRDTTLNRDSFITAGFQQVLAIHKVDSTTFYRSLNWYRGDAKRFKLLLDSAFAYAERERTYRFKGANADTLAKDSLK